MKPQCHSPLKGKAYRDANNAVACLLCDCEMEWENCSSCVGDGFFDGYEHDPNWYHPGEMVNCHTCDGQGGDYWCITPECPTNIAFEILPEKPAT